MGRSVRLYLVWNVLNIKPDYFGTLLWRLFHVKGVFCLLDFWSDSWDSLFLLFGVIKDQNGWQLWNIDYYCIRFELYEWLIFKERMVQSMPTWRILKPYFVGNFIFIWIINWHLFWWASFKPNMQLLRIWFGDRFKTRFYCVFWQILKWYIISLIRSGN